MPLPIIGVNFTASNYIRVTRPGGWLTTRRRIGRAVITREQSIRPPQRMRPEKGGGAPPRPARLMPGIERAPSRWEASRKRAKLQPRRLSSFGAPSVASPPPQAGLSVGGRQSAVRGSFEKERQNEVDWLEKKFAQEQESSCRLAGQLLAHTTTTSSSRSSFSRV
jgi:hypothetical protein